MATARSLKLSDGLRVSSFSQRRSTPRLGASRAASSSGVEPTGSDRAGAASTRQQLQVAPDSRRAPRDRFVRQRGRDHLQVVGHLERPEAGRTDIRQGDRLGEPAVTTRHADEARGCVVGRRAGGRGRRCQRIDRHGVVSGRSRRGAARGPVRTDEPDRFEGAPKSSLISQEDLPGIGTLPASRR